MKVTLKIGNDVLKMANDAERAMNSAPDLEIFQRGTELVELVGDSTTPEIRTIQNPRLYELVSHYCNFVTEKVNKDNEVSEVPKMPPREVVNALAVRGHWKFRKLKGVVQTPTIRTDGSLLTKAGYDSGSSLYFQPPKGVVFRINDHPSREDGLVALEVLKEAIVDFVFPEPCFHSAALSMILTPLVRPAISGSCPLFAIEAPTQGSGKGLLADVAGIIVTGSELSRMAQTSNETEDAKRIASLISGGVRIVLIDNVEHRFGHGLLGALITSATWNDRLLGGNAMGPWDNLAVWIITGNNLAYHDDMVRRVIPVLIDTGLEKPEQRTAFMHNPLEGWLKANRGELVSAALTVIGSYFAAGRPAMGLPNYGSFQAWSDVVRSALVWLGQADPCEARKRIMETGDPRSHAFGNLIAAWFERYGKDSMSIRDAINTADEDLRELMFEMCPARNGRDVDGHYLGNIFRRYVGRPLGGLVVAKGGKSTGHLVLWRVVKHEPANVVHLF